jgi:hypothetical protein
LSEKSTAVNLPTPVMMQQKKGTGDECNAGQSGLD